MQKNNVEELGLIDQPPTPEALQRELRAYMVRYVALVAVLSLMVGGLIGRLTAQENAAVTGSDPAWGWRPAATLAHEEVTPLSPTPAPLHVYVSGAVAQPQVVIVPAGSLVADALAAAGGPSAAADLERVNLAAPLADYQHVHIPARPDAPTATRPPVATAPATTDTATSTRLNINIATLEELLTLPGIGETRARAILAYRQEHGPFARIEDLQNVSGIGPSTVERLAPYITVEP